jgi:hypothetical protein
MSWLVQLKEQFSRGLQFEGVTYSVNFCSLSFMNFEKLLFMLAWEDVMK